MNGGFLVVERGDEQPSQEACCQAPKCHGRKHAAANQDDEEVQRRNSRKTSLRHVADSRQTR